MIVGGARRGKRPSGQVLDTSTSTTILSSGSKILTQDVRCWKREETD